MALSKEDTKYFENLFDMFATPGWKKLMEEMQDRKSATVDHITKAQFITNEDYNFNKGILHQTEMFLNLENMVTTTYEAAKDSEED